MVAAMKLRDAGCKLQMLEYNGRPGGRNWTPEIHDALRYWMNQIYA